MPTYNTARDPLHPPPSTSQTMPPEQNTYSCTYLPAHRRRDTHIRCAVARSSKRRRIDRAHLHSVAHFCLCAMVLRIVRIRIYVGCTYVNLGGGVQADYVCCSCGVVWEVEGVCPYIGITCTGDIVGNHVGPLIGSKTKRMKVKQSRRHTRVYLRYIRQKQVQRVFRPMAGLGELLT